MSSPIFCLSNREIWLARIGNPQGVRNEEQLPINGLLTFANTMAGDSNRMNENTREV
jgi:hypothetical protein